MIRYIAIFAILSSTLHGQKETSASSQPSRENMQGVRKITSEVLSIYQDSNPVNAKAISKVYARMIDDQAFAFWSAIMAFQESGKKGTQKKEFIKGNLPNVEIVSKHLPDLQINTFSATEQESFEIFLTWLYMEMYYGEHPDQRPTNNNKEETAISEHNGRLQSPSNIVVEPLYTWDVKVWVGRKYSMTNSKLRSS